MLSAHESVECERSPSVSSTKTSMSVKIEERKTSCIINDFTYLKTHDVSLFVSSRRPGFLTQHPDIWPCSGCSVTRALTLAMKYDSIEKTHFKQRNIETRAQLNISRVDEIPQSPDENYNEPRHVYRADHICRSPTRDVMPAITAKTRRMRESYNHPSSTTIVSAPTTE